MTEHKIIQKAFPLAIRENVNSLLAKINVETKYQAPYFDTVLIENETIEIPTRNYYQVPNSLTNAKFSQVEKDILNCIFSRHNNGYIRQEAILNIIESNNYWVIPYIIRIIGEHVVEILMDINNHFEKINKQNLISFIKENPKFYDTTRSRVVSYWNCYHYYRRKYPQKLNKKNVVQEQYYFGFQLLKKIDKLL